MIAWDDDQRRAIETIDADICVDAAAGSGKTTVLTERILRLLERGIADLDEIVAVTFTDAAAGEMRERLRQKALAAGKRGEDKAQGFWREIAERIVTARIGTFHSFCAALLRTHAVYAGLDPEFQLLTDPESLLLREEIAQQTVDELLRQGDDAASLLASYFNTSQIVEVISGGMGNRTFVAAFETLPDATRADDIRSHWAQVKKELRGAVLDAFRNSPELYAIRNRLKGFLQQAPKEKYPDEGMTKNLEYIGAALDGIAEAKSPEEIVQYTKQINAFSLLRGLPRFWESKTIYRKALDDLNKIKEFVATLHDTEKKETDIDAIAAVTAAFVRVFQSALKNYQDTKRKRNVLDYDDLLTKTLTLLKNSPETTAREARGIRHLLVDEFQDTDTEQYEIINLLKRANSNICAFVVGDAKQSIYRFRGAEVEVFRLAHQNRLVLPLKNNYRSAPEIIAFINEFFSTTNALASVERPFGPMHPIRTDTAAARIEFLLPLSTSEEERRMVKADQQKNEAALIVERLKEMCDPDRGVLVSDSQGTRRATFGDVAILFRAYSNLHIYEREFQNQGIPYRVVTGKGFYERQEIVDLVNLLKTVLDPWDELALVGFLRSPLVGLSDDSLLLLSVDRPLLQTFVENLVPAEFSQEKEWNYARNLIANLRNHVDQPLPRFLQYVLEETGYEAILLGQPFGVQKASNVRKLLMSAQQFGNVRGNRLAAFVRYVSQVGGEDIAEGDAPVPSDNADAVTFMTIHKAKGLEFPIVVIPNLYRSFSKGHSIPILADRQWGIAAKIEDEEGEKLTSQIGEWIDSLHRKKDIAEEARILYVGMTRARDYLLLGMGVEPQPDSWQEITDTAFHIFSKQDGEEVLGKEGTWKGIVRRTLKPAPPVQKEHKEEPFPDEKILQDRIAPLVVPVNRRRRFTVREVAAAIANLQHNSSIEFPYEVLHPMDAFDPLLHGELLHRILQTWDFRTDLQQHTETLIRREFPSLHLPENAAEIVTHEITWFLSTEPGSRLTTDQMVRREVPFLLRIDDYLISGAIDLLLGDGTIFDYKTGVSQRHTPAHEWQLRLYALAAHRLGEKISSPGYLCYLTTQEIVPVMVSEQNLRETWILALEAIH